MKVTYIGETIWNNRKCDEWSCLIKGVSLDFFTGLLLRKNGKPVEPSFNDVMECLLSDYDAGQMTFKEFCDTYGYDVDSRKAQGVRRSCLKNCIKLESIYTTKELEEIKSQLEI